MAGQFYIMFDTAEQANERIRQDSNFTQEYRQASDTIINLVGKIVWQKRRGK